MAQTYEIDINRYNGTDYDTLLPTPATHANTHKADGTDPVTANKTASLTVAGWSNNEQTVAVQGVTTNSSVIVSPDANSFTAYGEAGIYCSAQAANSLTFTCESVPTTALTVNVLIIL